MGSDHEEFLKDFQTSKMKQFESAFSGHGGKMRMEFKKMEEE
jgi:hypothetical protein